MKSSPEPPAQADPAKVRATSPQTLTVLRAVKPVRPDWIKTPNRLRGAVTLTMVGPNRKPITTRMESAKGSCVLWK